MVKVKIFLIVLSLLLSNSFLNAQSSLEDWQLLGLENLTIEYVYAKGDTIWVGAIDSLYKYSIHYSFTRGAEWSQIIDTSSLIDEWLKLLLVNPRNSSIIYARTFNGRGLKSTDGGDSWHYLIPDAEPWPEHTYLKHLYISPDDENLLFSIVTESRFDNLYRTTDGGTTWENVSSFPSSSHGVDLSFAFDPIDSTKIYVCGDNKMGYTALYISFNFGNSWAVLSESIFTEKLIVDWSNNNRIFALPLRSEDGGITWERIMEDIIIPGVSYYPSPTSLLMNPTNPDILYSSIMKVDSVIEPLGVFRTINGGDNWTLIEGSQNIELVFSGVLLSNLFYDAISQNLYVGSAHGLYALNSLVTVKNENVKPTKFELHQNYPNPFNPTTTIKYSIPTVMWSHSLFQYNVKLIVYDILGNEIVTLINKSQNPGNYEVTFDASNLSSGIYLYKIFVGDFTTTKKMIFLK